MKISVLLTSLLAFCAILLNAVPQTSAAEPPVPLAFIVPADGQSLDAAMTRLAKQVVAADPETRPGEDPTTPYRIDVVAGDYAAAEAALVAARKGFDPFSDPDGAFVFFHIVATAMRSNTETGEAFAAAFEDAFRHLYVPLDDKAAAGVDYWTEVTYWLATDPTVAESRFRAQLQAQNGKSTIALADAIALVSAYQLYQEQATTRPLMERLVSQDDEWRYIVSNVLVKTREGVSLSAYVARSRTAPDREPAALFFTIYSSAVGNRVYAKYAAAHGYVGVIADARGKRLSPDKIRPFETEATDTHEVIDWIARQPWSDGQVGMWGGSYSGFAQWAALKHRPAALKTIVPYVADLPGDGLPMEHNVFLNANYAWNFYVMDNRFVDEPLYQQRDRWIDLTWNWFTSGHPLPGDRRC